MSDKNAKKKRRGGKKRERLYSEIEAKRQDVSHALDVLRVGAHREFAFLPKGEKWLLPSVAFAIGVAWAGGSGKDSYRPPAQATPRTDPSPGDPTDTASDEDAADKKSGDV